MFAGLLGTMLVLVQPQATGAEILIVAALTATAMAILVTLRPVATLRPGTTGAALDGFADLRVLLRASDPDAEGHRRARAPGATR